MNVGIYLNYIGLGSNLLHLSYCHEIAKKYGPVTIITLCKNLDQAVEDDPNIEKVVYIEKNNSKDEEILVKTTKAEGQKCPVCWKINKKPCERHFS